MKKIFINPEFSRRRDSPKIKFNVKTGLVRLNRSLIQLLKVKIGDEISLFYDEENPEDWFVMVVKGNGFTLRKISSSGDQGFGARIIIEKLISQFKISQSKNFFIPVSNEYNKEAEGFALITAAIKTD